MGEQVEAKSEMYTSETWVESPGEAREALHNALYTKRQYMRMESEAPCERVRDKNEEGGTYGKRSRKRRWRPKAGSRQRLGGYRDSTMANASVGAREGAQAAHKDEAERTKPRA
jgi:hypothetical protein